MPPEVEALLQTPNYLFKRCTSTEQEATVVRSRESYHNYCSGTHVLLLLQASANSMQDILRRTPGHGTSCST
jgi:hypothetical protein